MCSSRLPSCDSFKWPGNLATHLMIITSRKRSNIKSLFYDALIVFSSQWKSTFIHTRRAYIRLNSLARSCVEKRSRCRIIYLVPSLTSLILSRSRKFNLIPAFWYQTISRKCKVASKKEDSNWSRREIDAEPARRHKSDPHFRIRKIIKCSWHAIKFNNISFFTLLLRPKLGSSRVPRERQRQSSAPKQHFIYLYLFRLKFRVEHKAS